MQALTCIILQPTQVAYIKHTCLIISFTQSHLLVTPTPLSSKMTHPHHYHRHSSIPTHINPHNIPTYTISQGYPIPTHTYSPTQYQPYPHIPHTFTPHTLLLQSRLPHPHTSIFTHTITPTHSHDTTIKDHPSTRFYPHPHNKPPQHTNIHHQSRLPHSHTHLTHAISTTPSHTPHIHPHTLLLQSRLLHPHISIFTHTIRPTHSHDTTIKDHSPTRFYPHPHNKPPRHTNIHHQSRLPHSHTHLTHAISTTPSHTPHIPPHTLLQQSRLLHPHTSIFTHTIRPTHSHDTTIKDHSPTRFYPHPHNNPPQHTNIHHQSRPPHPHTPPHPSNIKYTLTYPTYSPPHTLYCCNQGCPIHTLPSSPTQSHPHAVTTPPHSHSPTQTQTLYCSNTLYCNTHYCSNQGCPTYTLHAITTTYTHTHSTPTTQSHSCPRNHPHIVTCTPTSPHPHTLVSGITLSKEDSDKHGIGRSCC